MNHDKVFNRVIFSLIALVGVFLIVLMCLTIGIRAIENFREFFIFFKQAFLESLGGEYGF
jgi:ABC-type phosphate transport system permease subunit